MPVKGDPVDIGPLRNLANGNLRKILFPDQLPHGIMYGLPGTLIPSVFLFHRSSHNKATVMQKCSLCYKGKIL